MEGLASFFSGTYLTPNIFRSSRKKRKKRKEPWGEDSAIEKKATVKNIDYLTFLRLLLSQFFFRIFAFSSTLTRERIFETVWGVGNLLCDTLTWVVWFFKCSSHFPNCVYADCERQKKKKKMKEKTMLLTFVVNEEALIDLKCAKTYI